MKSYQDKYWEQVTKGNKKMKIVDFLAGKKTYLVAIVLAVLNFSVAMGWVSPENLEQINLILVALGFGALRSGISKAE